MDLVRELGPVATVLVPDQKAATAPVVVGVAPEFLYDFRGKELGPLSVAGAVGDDGSGVGVRTKMFVLEFDLHAQFSPGLGFDQAAKRRVPGIRRRVDAFAKYNVVQIRRLDSEVLDVVAVAVAVVVAIVVVGHAGIVADVVEVTVSVAIVVEVAVEVGTIAVTIVVATTITIIAIIGVAIVVVVVLVVFDRCPEFHPLSKVRHLGHSGVRDGDLLRWDPVGL